MLLPRRLLSLLLALALVGVGCSTSRQAAGPRTAPPPDTATTAEAPPPAETPPEEPDAPAEEAPDSAEVATNQAPDDWYHLSEDEGGYAGIATERAYAFLDGRRPEDTVVVAVLDGGVDVDHEDLDEVLWTNTDEVPGNDADDDENGYVDDVHGWNFLGGPDGENVEHDTFELTRIYADLRGPYEGANPDTLTEAERAEYDRYQKIKKAYQQEKQELTQQYNQVQKIAGFLEQARPLVEGALSGSGPITLKRLSTLAPDAGARTQQAAQAFTSLLRQSGASSIEDIVDELQQAEEQLGPRLEYSLNPDFNPRPIVGDDYADATERIYGNPDVEGPDPSHGTAVASLVAAERDNDVGLRGVAGAVKVMPVRTVPGGDERDKDVANAIRYATDNGADVINMSFGKSYSPRKDVVDAAVRYADEAGVLMVHAAGNDAANIDTSDSFPSKYYAEEAGVAENWIEVGASAAQSDSLLAASFSNYGAERVDLFAPGASIYVARPGNKYGRSDGTSMAAPIVTGVAALVMAYYPELPAEAVKQALLSSATDYAGQQVHRPSQEPGPPVRMRFGDLSQTGGVVNALEALRTAEQLASE